MTYVRLRPDVPGELGDQTQLDASTHPPRVGVFHLDVSAWSGDDLVECFPCFAVTPALAAALREAAFSGYSLGDMVTTEHPDQRVWYPLVRVPKLARLFVTGRAGIDDAGIEASFHLVVSSRMWELLQTFRVEQCEADPQP